MNYLTKAILLGVGVAVVFAIIVAVIVTMGNKNMATRQRKARDRGVEYIIDRKHNLCFAWHERFRKGGLASVPCEALGVVK